MSEHNFDEYLQTYRDMVGFVPPRVQSRFDLLSVKHPELLDAQEKLRNLAIYPESLDQHQVQLTLFGILASQLSDAAVIHGAAAIRAGATWEQLQAVINLAALFGGVSVSNRSPALFDSIEQFLEKGRS